jgi:hypothetical protein
VPIPQDPLVEQCVHEGRLLALVVRRGFSPASTRFVTPDDTNQQVGFIVYGRGTEIPRHSHLPLERHIKGTTEVVLVRAGSCTAEIYDSSRTAVVAEFRLETGDLILLNGGAHGFKVHEDTVLLEVKQGPFMTAPEKERF